MRIKLSLIDNRDSTELLLFYVTESLNKCSSLKSLKIERIFSHLFLGDFYGITSHVALKTFYILFFKYE